MVLHQPLTRNSMQSSPCCKQICFFFLCFRRVASQASASGCITPSHNVFSSHLLLQQLTHLKGGDTQQIQGTLVLVTATASSAAKRESTPCLSPNFALQFVGNYKLESIALVLFGFPLGDLASGFNTFPKLKGRLFLLNTN